MTSVSYNERERRLILEGPCWPGDDQGVGQAIETYADPGRGLIVDLTRLAGIPTEVAGAIAGACQDAEQRGCRVLVWTPYESRPTWTPSGLDPSSPPVVPA
jgi:hypothetical protein